jgi:hypothetical protein
MSGNKPAIGNADHHPSDGHIDDDDTAERPTHQASGEERSTSQPRYLPIEADSERRRKIEADSTINPDHLGTLGELRLLLTSDEEKTRVFCGCLDQEARAILDDLLEVAIEEIEVEHATVVGIVNVLLLRMLDIRGALRIGELGRLLGHR